MGWFVERFGIKNSTAATIRRPVLPFKAHTARKLTPSFSLYVSQKTVTTLLCSSLIPPRGFDSKQAEIEVIAVSWGSHRVLGAMKFSR